MRRRRSEGTVHPTYYQGRLTGYRGLASYKDPQTGRQRRRSVTRATRAEAERALRALIRTLPIQNPRTPRTARAPELPRADDPASLHALILRWLEHKRRDIRPATYRAYVNALWDVVEHLGARMPAELTVLDIETFVTRLRDEQGARKAGRALHQLRMVLKQAVRWEVLGRNVAEAARKPKVDREEMLVWTPAQVARFLEAARAHRLAPLFTLAISTGMRKGELLGLQWEDVDLEGRLLTVRRSLSVNPQGQYEVGLPKTDKGRRRVALAQDTVEALRAHWRAEHRGRRAPRAGDFVFTAASGNYVQPRQLDKVYRALTQAAGVPRIRFHDLRHTAASLLIRRGVPAKVVADRLGHADPSFTLKVYTHVYDDQRTAAALSLGELLDDPRTAAPPRPGSATEWTQGRDALARLHAALGEFLTTAPEWAREYVLAKTREKPA